MHLLHVSAQTCGFNWKCNEQCEQDFRLASTRFLCRAGPDMPFPSLHLQQRVSRRMDRSTHEPRLVHGESEQVDRPRGAWYESLASLCEAPPTYAGDYIPVIYFPLVYKSLTKGCHGGLVKYPIRATQESCCRHQMRMQPVVFCAKPRHPLQEVVALAWTRHL